MKKDSFWFSHDDNAIDDPKIMIMTGELGLEGYGIYWVVVEHLRKQPNYRSSLIVLKPLAIRHSLSEEKFKAVVLRYSLFEIQDDIFFSISLCQRMGELEKSREKKSMAGKLGNQARWGSDRNAITSGSHRNRKSSLVKESKVKESKGEIIQEIQTKEIVVVNSKPHVNNKFFEMFRRAAGRHISDEELIVEIGKFENKYPNVHPNACGGLVNTWVGNIGRDLEKSWQKQPELSEYQKNYQEALRKAKERTAI